MNDTADQLIFGKHPVLDSLKNGDPVDKVWMQIGLRGDYSKRLRDLCKTANVPVQQVPKEKLNKLVRHNHQGVVAFMSAIRYYKLEDLVPRLYENETPPLILVLDGVTDVRNFGAIARSAEVLGAHALVVGKKKAARINSEAIKTAAGALSNIPVCRENSPLAAIEFLKLSGIKIFSSDLKAEKTIGEIDFTGPTALIVGAEGRGVHPSLTALADENFIIPQSGKTDSLNVGVATGIMLYEVSRQRQL